MQKTKIEYLTHDSNPIKMRCTPVSVGCDRCWHLRFCNRHKSNPNFSADIRNAYAGGKPVLREKEFKQWLSLKTPARIGVQFMGDFFHEKVPDSFIYEVFAGMVEAPQHTYMILTKRPKRMLKFINGIEDWRPAQIPFIWLGVSVEDQRTADERIPLLLQTPAAKRFVSYEPALGPVDFKIWLYGATTGLIG